MWVTNSLVKKIFMFPCMSMHESGTNKKEIRPKVFKQFKTFSHKFPIDFRIARTDYGLYDSVKIFTNDCVSATNPNNCLFVAICRIRGLCGIRV